MPWLTLWNRPLCIGKCLSPLLEDGTINLVSLLCFSFLPSVCLASPPQLLASSSARHRMCGCEPNIPCRRGQQITGDAIVFYAIITVRIYRRFFLRCLGILVRCRCSAAYSTSNVQRPDRRFRVVYGGKLLAFSRPKENKAPSFSLRKDDRSLDLAFAVTSKKKGK